MLQSDANPGGNLQTTCGARERESGTIQLLFSAPIRDWEIVVGKYISALLFLMVYMGVYPAPFLSRSDASVKAIHERVMKQAGGTVELLREPVIRRKRRMTRTVAGDETEPEQTDDAATEAPTEQGQ